MLIDDGAQAQRLRTLVSACPLRETHKEALLGGEIVNLTQLLRTGLLAPRHPRQKLPAEIGNVLTRGERTVDLHIIDDDILGILAANALRALFECRRIPRRPPLAQIAIAVILATLVVKAVRQLMADGAAGVTVVGRVVPLWIIEGRGQTARRKIDVIQRRVVVGIDGGRGHLPLAAIDRLADLRRLAAGLKGD